MQEKNEWIVKSVGSPVVGRVHVLHLGDHLGQLIFELLQQTQTTTQYNQQTNNKPLEQRDSIHTYHIVQQHRDNK